MASKLSAEVLRFEPKLHRVCRLRDFKLVLTKLVADLIDGMCCATVVLTNLEQMWSLLLTDVSANFVKDAACYTLRRAILKGGMKACFCTDWVLACREA
ncbi:MAG: hypothetical protein ACKERG_01860 [Candidatus Hodgkinia cicadicola]